MSVEDLVNAIVALQEAKGQKPDVRIRVTDAGWLTLVGVRGQHSIRGVGLSLSASVGIAHERASEKFER